MKRSEINAICREAECCFERHGWSSPPKPRWDVTDFGLGDFDRFGLVLINLAEEPEYCEKLMYSRAGQTTPLHTDANFFVNPDIGRFPHVEEDEPAILKLLSDPA